MTSAPAPGPVVPRLASIDAYRGAVMFLMMAEVLRFSRVSAARPDSAFWRFLDYHQSHVAWVGCSLHDLIQPSFSFLVGVALPFSIASRMARGQGWVRMTTHACGRAFLLIALGIFLRSLGRPQLHFTFEDTLTQIGLGYGFLFLLGLRSARWHWAALGVILAGYWLAFACHPLPGPDFDWSAAGVAADWPHHATGFAAHWNKNANAASAFDTGFLNGFPRERAFLNNGGGYCTLSFIPTLGTMILGLIAGNVLRREGSPWRRAGWLALAGAACLAAGWFWGWTGTCPVVKRIWTPSWVLFSGGWCLLALAAFFAVMDIVRVRAWAFPWVVIGMNSIAAYVLTHLVEGFIKSSLRTLLGPRTFAEFGGAYAPLLEGAAVLLVLWLILFWMYRRKLFLKI